MPALVMPASGAETPPGVAVAPWLSLAATPPALNRKTGAFESKVTITNRSPKKPAVFGPLSLVLRAANRPGVSLADPAGASSLGPYVFLQVPGGKLEPKQKLKSAVVRFAYTGKKSFKPNFALYGLLAPNRPPVAEAGADQTIAVGATAALNGAASTDADGQPLTYRWTLVEKPAGSAAALNPAEGPQTLFIVDKPGRYRARLIVSDRIADSAPDFVAISTSNSKPVAEAGRDQTVPVGTLATLDGRGSRDPDGDLLFYSWSFKSRPEASAAQLNGAGTATPSFTPDQRGRYEAQLVVNDGQVVSDPDTVVDTQNSKPLANAGPELDAEAGSGPLAWLRERRRGG